MIDIPSILVNRARTFCDLTLTINLINKMWIMCNKTIEFVLGIRFSMACQSYISKSMSPLFIEMEVVYVKDVCIYA